MLARCEGQTVVEVRDLVMEAVPDHKRHLWKPLVGDLPQVDSRIATLSAQPTYIVEADQVRREWAVTHKPLDEVKTFFLRKIETDAEAARLKHITGGVGMAMTYQEKFAQAQAVQAMGKDAANALTKEAREAQFPTLSASVGLEADTLWDCAQLVLQRYTAFAQLSMMIERTRLSAKKAVSAAMTVAEAAAAYDAVTWPIQ